MSKAHSFSMGPLVWFIGVVEDRKNDPHKAGRVKVRVYGYHSASTSDIPTKDLMWAIVMSPTTSASISGIGESPSGIVEGATVVGWFLDGQDAQVPMIIGTLPGMPANGPQSGQGFNDPNGKYPNYEENEADVNRLARGETSNVEMLDTKKSNRVKDVETASGGDGSGPKWSQPETPYAAKYPNNHVRFTESGHTEEFDDTEGSERINRFHKSGTFTEIGPDGTEVTQIVKDGYRLVAGDDYVAIEGKCNVTIGGDARVKIGGDAYLDVSGDMNQSVQGNLTLKVQGDMKTTVQGSRNDTTSGDHTVKGARIMLN